jgi:hypothetical protein
MGIQGVLSICKGGEVTAKVVAGCNSKGIPALAAAIRATAKMPGPWELSVLCRKHKVGCDHCLVILTPEAVLLDATEIKNPEELENRLSGHKLYRETFSDPRFNPRWPRGTADFVEVVDL